MAQRPALLHSEHSAVSVAVCSAEQCSDPPADQLSLTTAQRTAVVTTQHPTHHVPVESTYSAADRATQPHTDSPALGGTHPAAE
jgi:hypothetical protein